MKKTLNIINDLNITTKIFLGFGLVFCLFGLLSFGSFQNLKKEKENVGKISLLSENTSIITDINREISEIQRLVNVYSLTGGDSIIEKIRESYSSLTKKLVDVTKKTSSKERQKLLLSLKKVLNSFGENIDVLENRYKYREELLGRKLPESFSVGARFLEDKLKEAQGKRRRQEVQTYQVLLGDWYKLNFNATNFLNKRDYKFKKEVQRIKKSMIAVKNYSDHKVMEEMINTYYSLFDQSVQANRIYLSLVNVVMAGAALEFSTVSEKLRKDSIAELDSLLRHSDIIFIENKNLIYLSLLISIPLLLLIGLYYQLNIAKGISKISETFKGFIAGDLSLEVPGLNRRDEVGELAKAADNFKEISKRIKKERARAERLTESKSKFLATMSHEIRTPMNAVLSCANLLLDETNNPAHQDLLKTIKTSGDSLLILINDILDFSKIESGKINLENEVFDLPDCVNGVLDLLGPNASKRGVLLELDKNSEMPDFVNGDTTRIRQVLVNLIGNAIKFTKDRVTLKIHFVKLEESNVKLYFRVIDNGIGIEKEAQSELFKEFSQVDASTTRKFGGTGLGLAICKGIVGAMNGEIGVDSVEGEGAEFYFSVIVNRTESKKKYKQSLKIEKIELEEHQNLKILMAEDNSINQMVARKMLEKMGFRIDVVSNGLEAINAVREMEYDVIFMDQHMPELDGIEATKKIRSLNIQQPRIYALTASAFEEDRVRCLSAGMDGFLTKPIIFENVVGALRETLSLKYPQSLRKTS